MNAAAYAAAFTEDADYISFDGRRARGRNAIESSHRRLFEGPPKVSTTVGAQADVRPLTDDVALVVPEGGTAVEGGPRRASIVTLTAARAPDDRRFASFQNARVTA